MLSCLGDIGLQDGTLERASVANWEGYFLESGSKECIISVQLRARPLTFEWARNSVVVDDF